MRRGVILLGLLASCHPASKEITISDDIAYVAWAITDDDGNVTYTALTPVDEPRVFSVGDDTKAVLLGFDASVGDVIERFGVDVSRTPLRPMEEDCGPRVASPTTLHTTFDASQETPPLTANWVEAVCLEDRRLAEGVDCDVCVEPDCRGFDVVSTPVPVDPAYGIYSLESVSWADDTTLFAAPAVAPDAAVVRIDYDLSVAVPAPIVQVEPLLGANEVQQLTWSEGNLWIVDGDRLHRATRNFEIVETFQLSGRLAVHGGPNGPTIVHRFNGPAFQITETGTVARPDLPDDIHALSVVGPDEIVAVGSDALAWIRGGETYRYELPAEYASMSNLSDAFPTVASIGDTVVITARGLPVFRHTRDQTSWVRTPWPTNGEGEARGSTALGDGLLVVGQAGPAALMYIREEGTCFMRLSVIASINAVASAPRDGFAMAVTGAVGVLPARLVDIRVP